MTLDEAIFVLEKMKNTHGVVPAYEVNALSIAIRSLEAWEKVKEDIVIKSLGEWYVGRTDGKSEDVILTKDVYDIITKHLKEVENDR